MKKLTTKILGAILGIGLVVGSGAAIAATLNTKSVKEAKADTITRNFDFATVDGQYNRAQSTDWYDENILVNLLKYGGSNGLTTSYFRAPRLYSSHYLSFTPAPGITLSKVNITFSSATYPSTIAGNNTPYNVTVSYSSKTLTLTPIDGGERFEIFIEDTGGAAEVKSMTYEYSVNSTSTPIPIYQLVTDESQLTAGSKILLVGSPTYNGVTYDGAFHDSRLTDSSSLQGRCEVSMSNGYNYGSVLTSRYARPFTLGGESGAWIIANDAGCHFQVYKNPSSTTSAYFRNKVELMENYIDTLDISFDSSHAVKITGNEAIYSSYELRCDAGEYSGFGITLPYSCLTYTTAGTKSPIYMFVQKETSLSYEAQAYVNSFLGGLSTGDTPICSADGETDLNLLKNAWVAYKLAFDDLVQTDKDQLTYGFANENGTDLQRALALYDFIASKYGTSLESENCANYNFMGRASAIHNSYVLNPITKTTQVALIVVISSVICISSVGLFFLIRKRKEQ